MVYVGDIIQKTSKVPQCIVGGDVIIYPHVVTPFLRETNYPLLVGVCHFFAFDDPLPCMPKKLPVQQTLLCQRSGVYDYSAMIHGTLNSSTCS